jgi:hypothetical protein
MDSALSTLANPYSLTADTTSSGIPELAQSFASQIPRRPQPTAAEPSGKVWFSPTKREFYINGIIASEDDDTTIEQAEALLDRPTVGAPQGEDWLPVDQANFAQIADKIRNPSLGRLFAKNFGIGVDQLQQLAGSALQAAGAEDLGGRIVEAQEEDLAKTSVYQREFTDIESAGGAIDWFVATLGQQGPMLLESVAAAAAGAAAGTVAGGPGLGTAGGAIAGFVGKKAFKESVEAASKRYSAAKAKGVAPNPADIKTLKNAAAITGAVTGAYLSSYATGVGDIYGELREQGADADDVAARLSAFSGAIPYAALETLPEFLIASRIFGSALQPRAMPTGASRTRRGAELLRRGGAGAGVGALAEGLTEIGQEGLVMGLSGQDLTSDEAVKRFINSFAAGAAVGGTLGGVANLRRGSRAGELGPAPEGTGGEISLLDSTGSVTGELRQTRGIQPRTEPGQALADRGFIGDVQPGELGPQGVIDLGDMTVGEARLRARDSYGAPMQLEGPREAAPLPVPPGQGALQFAPAAPEGIGFTDQPAVPNTLMAQQMQAAQRQQDMLQAEQQRAQEQAAEREQQINLMQAQQQLQFAEQGRIAEQLSSLPQPPQQMPMVPVQPRAPQQLPLFTPAQAPRPSRAEGLRRGVGTQPEPMAPVAAEPVGRAPRQLPLFTQRGEPTVAALRAAGQTGPLPLPTLEAGATQIPPTGSPVNAVTIAAARQRLALKRAVGRVDYGDGDAYEGQLKNGVPNGDGISYLANGDAVTGKYRNGQITTGTYLFADGSTYVGEFKDGLPDGQGVFTDIDGSVAEGQFRDGAFVPPEPPPTPKKAAALKRGKKDAVQKPSSAQVPARRGAQARAEVGEEVPTQRQAPREGRQEVPVQAQVTPLEPAFTPKTMAELEAEARAQRPLRVDAAPEPTVTELVDDAIATAEGTVDTDAFTDAASTLMFHAYVDTDTNNRTANAKARAFIEDTEFDAVQREALNDALIDEIDIKGQVELARAGEYKPVYKYLVDNNLLPRINATTTGLTAEDAARLVREGSLSLTNLSDKTAKDVISANPELVADDANNLARGVKDDTRENAATRLANNIRDINLAQTALTPAVRATRIADIQAQWDALPDEYRDFVDETGTPLSQYFTDDVVNSTVVNKKVRITKTAYTEEQVAAFEADENAEPDPELRAFEQEESGRNEESWNAWNEKLRDGGFSRDDGTAITQPLAVGRIRMAVTKFLNKLAVKPRVFIYRDQADLKAKNPRLHQRAADSRPEGDFDSTPAAGFSFGDGNVIIFSDYIATEQQLNFVMAHETLGHFGLRGIIPANKFDTLMEQIYRDNPGIQGDVDAAMNARNMPRAEAVEEYLSDFAAQLDTSIVSRVWNAIKGALNKLGVQFGDESARYFISQARRYVRDGRAGVPFEVSKVMQRLYDVEYGTAPVSTGRFAVNGSVYDDARTASLLLDKVGGLPDSFESGWQWLKGEGVNSVSTYDKFKAKFLSLANFRSRENAGAAAMESLINEMRDRSMSIKVEMNEKLRDVLNKALFGKFWGVTEQQLDNLNNVLYEAQRFAVSRFDQTKERSKEPLYRFEDGVLVPNQPEIDRLSALGRVTFEQMRDGFEYQVDALQNGKFVKETVRFPGIEGLTENSIEWTGYEKLRGAMNDVELRLLRARYLSVVSEQNIAFDELTELMEGRELTNTDRSFLRKAINKYKSLYTEGLNIDEDGYVSMDEAAMTKGNDFLVAFNAAIIGKDTDRTAAAAAFFDGKVADDFSTQLNDFKTRLRLPQDNQFIVQNRVKQLVLSEMANTDADLFTRRSIGTGYTPILREGAYQIRVEATDPRTGKRLQLKDTSRDQLIYSQFEKPSESMDAAALINGVFEGKSYTVEVYDADTGAYVMREVKLTAVSEAALDSVAAPPELNLNEFVRGLRQFDMAVSPQKMETIVKALTRQNSAARNRLQRAFVKGFKPEGTVAISRHIESRASTIAKTQLRPKLSELLNLNMAKSQRLWNGDPELLQKLKENSEQVTADTRATPEQKALAQREYDRYRFMYESTNPKGAPRKGLQYYNEASRTAAFLDGNRNVDESDFGSGKLVSGIRASTSMMQLGASIATGALNIIGAYTNGLPFLASYNEKNGFGGGFGLGPAVAQFHIAMKDVGGIGMNPFSETSRAANRAEFYDRVAASPELQAQYNLKDHEARFIAREIREGTMIPAQSNALVGTSRGQATKAWQQKFIDGWMLTFNLTEQSSRRTLGLAAYRLEYQRQISSGNTAAQASAEARRLAVSAMQMTLGEYSVLNRPPAWRSGIQSFMYMYKVFPTTSIQLFANLSRNGQIGMLAGLFILSGLAGMPFAEDLEDIIDTLSQKLGFKSGSIRNEIAKFVDDIFPGMSPYVLTGFANSALPGNIAGRTSLGNVLPGTGMFLSGTDVSREMMDIAGPAASAFTGIIKTASDAIRLPFSDQVSTLGVLRESPITMARAFADAYAYNQTGAIIDRRGYVVSRDMHAGTIAARLMGFYPTAAADQYSMIRVAKRMTDYQRDVSAGFRTAWINAMQTGDRQRARSIEESVAAWNNGAKGTALEIRNFRTNSQRALRDAQRPAGERALRSAPRAARQDIERLSTLLSY